MSAACSRDVRVAGESSRAQVGHLPAEVSICGPRFDVVVTDQNGEEKAMTITLTTTLSSLSHRDRAVLHAVAAGRWQISAGPGTPLIIDGIGCCDQLVGPRLIKAGLIAAVARPGPARLTSFGRGLLEAA
jgi:hypothetical protein